MNEMLKMIRQRRSVRKFLDTPVPDEMTDLILEAGKLAPCARNRQERHFTLIQSQPILAEMSQASKDIVLDSQDRYLSLMAQSENYHIFHHAPLVILVSGPDKPMVESDCAAAIQNMILAAESLGYSSCWVNFVLFLFQTAQGNDYHEKLGIPQGYRPYGSLAIGLKKESNTEERPIRGNTVTRIR